MANCPGERGTSTCNALLYHCKACGSIGCINEKCSATGFKDGSRCIKCGKFQCEVYTGKQPRLRGHSVARRRVLPGADGARARIIDRSGGVAVEAVVAEYVAPAFGIANVDAVPL